MASHTPDKKDRPHSGRQTRRRAQRARDGGEGLEAELSNVRGSLSQKIRDLRQQRGLTLRALAADAGVTSGFISQLENGVVMPSLATLLRIAAALDVRIGDLFDAPATPGRILHRDERVRFDYPSLGVRDEILSADAKERLEVLMGYIEPGGGSGEELYTHGADSEFVLVVEGAIELHLGDETFVLEEGDSITFSGDVPHGYTNSGETTAQLLWVMTPVSY
jgi:transcriptional regulator with XRE-family HTH domain